MLCCYLIQAWRSHPTKGKVEPPELNWLLRKGLQNAAAARGAYAANAAAAVAAGHEHTTADAGLPGASATAAGRHAAAAAEEGHQQAVPAPARDRAAQRQLNETHPVRMGKAGARGGGNAECTKQSKCRPSSWLRKKLAQQKQQQELAGRGQQGQGAVVGDTMGLEGAGPRAIGASAASALEREDQEERQQQQDPGLIDQHMEEEQAVGEHLVAHHQQARQQQHLQEQQRLRETSIQPDVTHHGDAAAGAAFRAVEGAGGDGSPGFGSPLLPNMDLQLVDMDSYEMPATQASEGHCSCPFV